ncbi:MAG TPA: VWA domain-containing protein [Vicinamibacterales bacterium]|nr:VWA domain-containing protein [Vicinamibacterales bacterium]
MRLGVLTGLFAMAVALVDAQAPQVFRGSVDLVPVFATATTADGAFARDLTKDDFTVLDNDKPQNIVSFSSDAQTLSVSVILDTSGSMQNALPRVFGAARAFIDRLTPEDRVMIGSLYFVGPPISSEKARLRTSLDMMPRDPGSPVFGAIDRSLTTLLLEPNRRVIVIYTDGKNMNAGPFGKTTAGQVLDRVEGASVMVYAIGFEGVSISGDMKKIAARSGGRATELRTNDDLGRALAGVADELHHQYLLGFTPAAFDGKTHKLEVRVKREGITVRARQSYVAVK